MNRVLLARFTLAVLALIGCAGCALRVVDTRLTPFELQASDGRPRSLPPPAGGARLTVLVFSAWHCPCQTAHDPRLGALYARYHGQGVDFFLVDSELGGQLAIDAAKAHERGYSFPVLLDPGASLARTLHAEYATESFVIDREGTVRYHGGLDSDRTTVHEDAVPLLANALDDLLLGKTPRSAETKALGCALQTW
jgi:hypothetical protein